ncbi:hypothetical protein [Maridesulfovibrio sp.]|uniref:hypothetical protein n=1 Tax=Maridesulfovibrio sp. TaxID=2795000 RepID=UPI0029CA3117|nr:hypothetical protein [Maridesulfovibrio sp.]
MPWQRPKSDGEVRTGIREALDNQGRPTGRMTRGQRYDFYSGGSGSLVVIDNGSERYLKHLAQSFPGEFNRALRSVGFHLQRYIKKSIYQSRVGGETIDPAETSPRFRRMAAFHRTGDKTDAPKRRMRNGRLIGGYRASKGGHRRAYGKVAQAIGYLHEPAKQQVQIGYMGLSSRSFGRALALGSRGGKYNWHAGPQIVTPRMRRFFAATGRALPADMTSIESPQRPVIDPAFEDFRPKIGPLMERRIAGYLKKERKK